MHRFAKIEFKNHLVLTTTPW